MEIQIVEEREELFLEYGQGRVPLAGFVADSLATDLELRTRAAQWLNGLNETPLRDETYLSSLFRVRGITLWWYMAPWLYENSFVPGAIALVGLIERLNLVLDKLGPATVKFDGGSAFVRNVIQHVCAARGVTFVTSASDRSLAVPAMRGHIKTARFLVRKLIWLFTLFRFLDFQKRSRDKRPRLLFMSGDTWQSYHDVVSGTEKRGDGHYGNLVTALGGEASIEFIHLMPKYRFKVRAYREKLRDPMARYTPLEGFLTFPNLIRGMVAWVQARRRWRDWVDQCHPSAHFVYKGVDCRWWFRESVDYYFCGPALEHILCLLTAEEVLKRNRPVAVLLSGENGVYGLSLILAARLAGVPVSSLQHGFLSRRDFCIHFRSHLHAARNEEISPFPDYLLLYGDFYKKLFARFAGLPEEKCIVTGAPRFDANLSMPRDRDAMRDRLGVDSKTFVILAAVNNPDKRLKYQALAKIFQSVSHLPNIKMVVKLHPEDAIRLGEYQQVAREANLKEVIFRADYELWPLFAASDIFVTEFSTIVIEGAAAGVPTVLVDFFNMDYAGYYENHPDLRVATSPETLRALVEAAIEDKQADLGTMKRFATDHLCSLDGGSTARVAEFMRVKMLRAER